MKNSKTKNRKRNLAATLYLTVVLPLVVASSTVIWFTSQSLNNNAQALAHALHVQSNANNVLPLLLIQDAASMSMLIDPTELQRQSSPKIKAYDQHKQLLASLKNSTQSKKILHILGDLEQLDEQHLRPLDSSILELLFDDVEKARARHLKEYLPKGNEYRNKIDALIQEAGNQVGMARAEQVRLNEISIGQVALTLAVSILLISGVIFVLARKVTRSETNMKCLLGSLSDGLFFFDRDGKIANERSNALESILPGSRNESNLATLMKMYAGTDSSNIDMCLQMLWGEEDGFFSSFETTTGLLPKQFTFLRDNELCTIRMTYRAQHDKHGNLESVICIASDMTQQLRAEKDAQVQAQRVRTIGRAASDFEGFMAFLDEINNLINSIDSETHSHERHQLKRDLHTLKGTLSSFEFTGLAEVIHSLENQLEEQEDTDVEKFMASWKTFVAAWTSEVSEIEKTLNIRADTDRMYVSRAKYILLLQELKSTEETALSDKLVDLTRRPLPIALKKFADYLHDLVKRKDKEIRLHFAPDSAHLTTAEIQSIDGPLVHILRNCIDHGMEASAERIAAGKAPIGSITIGCTRDSGDGSLKFVIADDGPGIDAEKLSNKAVECGIWNPQQRATADKSGKINLIFADSLSTSEQVSELSGRGVGMSAVKHAIESAGGEISVFSKQGRGTRFEIVVPKKTGGQHKAA